jgi:Asp-tRNA(Asn)/Glu-tRNA(Gln) amidotransferase A subunit family amidase
VVLREVELPASWRTLVAAQTQIQLYEQTQSLRHEHLALRDRLSVRLQGILDDGARVTIAQYDAAQQLAAQCRAELAQVLEGVDVLLAPSVIGPAPQGLDATGDPLFCRIWTLLHTPALNIPVGTAADGLPVGLQVVARPGDDALALSAAHALHQWLAH